MTSRNHAVLALALYASLSWLLLCQGASPARHVFGYGADPGLIMWFLAWWPWAVTHHALSLHTNLVWYPNGLNLGWTTSVPLLAAMAAPVTLLAGPLVAFNLLAVAAPAFSAWAAYGLCRGLGALPWAGFCGGLLFGFSSYMAAQSFDHLNLMFCPLLPLAVLAAVRRVKGQAGRSKTVLALAVLLGGQFLVSEELLASFCLFAVVAFGLAYAVESAWRAGLWALAVDAMLAAPLALLPAAPFLHAMAFGVYDIAHPTTWQRFFAVDAVNILVPTQGTWLGGQNFGALSGRFTGALDEQGGYLGLPLLALLGVILTGTKARRLLWLPLVMVGIIMLAALGPVLQWGGHVSGIKLPWALLGRVPLLEAALPGRFTLFAFLGVAIIVSLWLSWHATRQRFLLVGCVWLSLLPAPHPPWPSQTSPLFQPGALQRVVGADPVLLILPFGIAGPGSFWQAENGFGFHQVGGYLGYPPGWALADEGLQDLFHNRIGLGRMRSFVAVCQRYHVQYVVAGPRTPANAVAGLASLGWVKRQVGDVSIYTVPGAP